MQNFVRNQREKLEVKLAKPIARIKRLFDLRKRDNILSILGKIVIYAVLIVLS